MPTARFAAAPVRTRDRVTLYLLVGESCNLTCIYCLNGPLTYRKDNRASMSPAVAWRSVAMCLEGLEPGGCVEVAFFGGEPLLHWPRVKEVIRGCEDRLKPAHPDKRIHYHLTSNLTLCPPDLADWVAHYDITVLCGVDGPPEIHDRCRTYPGGGPSHARSAATIGRLVRAGARVTLRTTITSANHDCLDRVAAHQRRAGGRRLALRSGPPGQLGPGLLSRGDLAGPGPDHCRGPPIGPPGPSRQDKPLPI